MILKGSEGRSLLQQELEKKGAIVDSLALYSRRCPDYSNEHLQESIEHFDPSYIIALSGETLLNLLTLSKQANIDLKPHNFVLSSRRVANIALKEGLKLTHIANNLMPMDIIRCIIKARKAKLRP